MAFLIVLFCIAALVLIPLTAWGISTMEKDMDGY